MPIRLTVKTLDSSNYEFTDIEPKTLVKDFKAKIAERVNIPVERQRLIYCGRVLQDAKTLDEYQVDGKVVHLVQRAPPTSTGGPDRLAGAEARARSPAPGGRPGVHRHVHIHHGPPIPSTSAALGQPSPRARLNIANEMLRRAKLILESLENPNQHGRSASTSTHASTAGTSAESSTGNEVPRPNSNIMGVTSNTIQISGSIDADFGQGGGLPLGLAQTISSAVEQAMSGSVGVGPGQADQSFAMSVTLDSINIEPRRQTSPSTSNTASGRDDQQASSLPSSAPTSASNSAQASPSRGRNGGGIHIEYPPLSALADVMDEYQAVNSRLSTHWTRLRDFLRQDPVLQNNPTELQQRQASFNKITMVMHFLSHAQHAMSDMVMNLSQPPPRVLRARPVLFQSATPTMILPAGASTATRPPTSSTSTSSAAPPTSVSTSNGSTASSGTNTTPGIQIGEEISLNIPMMVGIEINAEEVPEAQHNTRRQSTPTSSLPSSVTGGLRSSLRGGEQSLPRFAMPGFVGPPNPDIIQNIIRSAFEALPVGGENVRVEISSATSAATTTSATSSTTSSGVQGASTRTSGAQTQPTSSTRTVTSHQILHGPFPRPIPGIPGEGILVGNVNSFDPFLPCNSHHLQRSSPFQSPQTRHLFHQRVLRPRSASVPLRRGGADSRQNGRSGQRQEATASGSSQETRPGSGISLGSWENRQNQPDGGGQFLFALDPNIMNFLQHLSQGGSQDPNNQDFMHMIQALLRQITGALSGGSQQSTTVREFLNNMPDYQYTEGESLFVDFLMCLSNVVSFGDIIQMIMGNYSSYSSLRSPLRDFFLKNILKLGNNQLSREEVDASWLAFADRIMPDLQELSTEVDVRQNVDFPETLHNFLTSRLNNLVYCIVSSNDQDFNRDFPSNLQGIIPELVALCSYCFVNNQASLERLVQRYLIILNEDTRPFVREWIMSAAMGHLRNYLANNDVSEDILTGYVVSSENAESRRKDRSSRMRPNFAASSTNKVNDSQDDEQFATPRSSPEPMETNDGEMKSESSATLVPEGEVIPEPVDSESIQAFPDSLLLDVNSGPDMVIGREAWHRVVPQEWVPVISRDINTQAQGESNSVQPFSDAYLSTQPAKRRKIAAESKPVSGPIRNAIQESLESAMASSGAIPKTGSRKLISSQVADVTEVEEAVSEETKKAISKRLKEDPNHDSTRFPQSSKVFKKDF